MLHRINKHEPDKNVFYFPHNEMVMSHTDKDNILQKSTDLLPEVIYGVKQTLGLSALSVQMIILVLSYSCQKVLKSCLLLFLLLFH